MLRKEFSRSSGREIRDEIAYGYGRDVDTASEDESVIEDALIIKMLRNSKIEAEKIINNPEHPDG